MATGQELGGQLLYMAGLVAVLFFILNGMTPRRRLGSGSSLVPYRARRDPRVLNQYQDGLAGPVVVGVLLVGELVADEGAVGWIVMTGLVLGVLSFSKGPFTVAKAVIAVGGLITVWIDVVSFILFGSGTGVFAYLVNIFLIVLICTSFFLGTLLAFSWRHGYTIRALCFVVVLEMVMLLAEPAAAVIPTARIGSVLWWACWTCVIAFVVGWWSYPVVLDLLAVALAITIALYGPDLAGSRHDLGAVIAGLLVAFVARWLLLRLSGRG